MNSIHIAPSLLSADFTRLYDEIAMVTKAGADVLHVDVMDGHFVPNITIGPCVVQSIRKVTKLPLDVHLMISDPAKYLEPFVQAGSDWITFHIEAVPEPMELIRKAKGLGVKVGVSLKPQTEVEAIAKWLPQLDLVLVMSVEPGFGGQKFQPQALEKLRQLKTSPGCPAYLSIDGGINMETARMAVEAGANVLVAGTMIFQAKDPPAMVRQLKEIGQE